VDRWEVTLGGRVSVVGWPGWACIPRWPLSAEAAFDRLTQLSQSENVKLHIVAERLVEETVRRARVRQR
jgi:ANTAR domain